MLLISYPQTSASNHPITLPYLLGWIVQIIPPLCRLMHHLAHYIHTVTPSIWQPLNLPEPRPTDRNGTQVVDLFSYLGDSRHFAGGFKVHDDFFVFVEDDDRVRGEVDYLHLRPMSSLKSNTFCNFQISGFFSAICRNFFRWAFFQSERDIVGVGVWGCNFWGMVRVFFCFINE